MTEANETRLYGVLSHAVDEVWEDVAPLLLEASSYADGKYDLEDVYNFIVHKDMQLWVMFNASGICGATVTQIIKYPRKKVLMLVFIAGEHADSWLNLIDGIKDFAKEHGCESIEGYGRPGWEKLSKPLGFEKIHTIFRLTLT